MYKKLKSFLRIRDKPTNSLPGSTFSFFFGGTAAGQAVNERTAMQMSAVYACVRILSEAIAALPLHFYEYNEKGGKEKALDHPLYVILHDEPKKVLILMLVGVANILDVHVVGQGSALRGAVIAFYLSNEGLSLLENAAYIGLPIPDKLREILEQLHNREDKTDNE